MKDKFTKLENEIRNYQAENKILIETNNELQNDNAKLKQQLHYVNMRCEKLNSKALITTLKSVA